MERLEPYYYYYYYYYYYNNFNHNRGMERSEKYNYNFNHNRGMERSEKYNYNFNHNRGMERSEKYYYNFKAEELLKYGSDMTRLAEMGILDSVIGREKEIERLTQVLLKGRKNNACLVGDPGIGKTAIVEALAIKIAANSVPDKLKGKRVFSIDMARVHAGAVQWGQFEERMIKVVDEVEASEGAVILFIDELHTLIKDREAGYSAPDAAAILKPALARGDLKCIGATTHEEYRKCIEKDAALKRRFQRIQVLEPSRDESYEILKGLIHRYQNHHRVIYTQNALISAIDLSQHYIREFLLPDQAIDLIDEAGARAHLLGKTHVTEAEIEHAVTMSTGIPMTEVSVKQKHISHVCHINGRNQSRKSVIDSSISISNIRFYT